MCFRPLAWEEGKPEAEGGTLQSTGQLGDVMKESTEIAYTFFASANYWSGAVFSVIAPV